MALTDIRKIADKYRPAIRDALLAAFEELRNQNTLNEIASIYEVGGIDAVMGTLSDMHNVLSQNVLDNIDSAIIEGGRTALQFIPTSGIVVTSYQFNVFHQPTVDFISQYRLNLINGITAETTEAIRTSLFNQAISGANPIDVARTFRGTIGLTTNQEQAVRNYRTALENLDRTALNRKLRDKRFDSTITRAIDNNTPLTSEQIDRYVNRYRERFIKYRSEMIARTESMRAVSVGQDESIRQMLQQGVLDDDLRQFWVYTKDNRTRDPHRLVPAMNNGIKSDKLGSTGEGIPLTQLFQTPLGPLRYPRDPNGTASNTINCRCRRVFRML